MARVSKAFKEVLDGRSRIAWLCWKQFSEWPRLQIGRSLYGGLTFWSSTLHATLPHNQVVGNSDMDLPGKEQCKEVCMCRLDVRRQYLMPRHVDESAQLLGHVQCTSKMRGKIMLSARAVHTPSRVRVQRLRFPGQAVKSVARTRSVVRLKEYV